jgi:peroxiredoxin
MARCTAVMVLVGAVLVTPALARAGGQYNDVLKIGALAPAWAGLPGVDGKTHSLADLKDKESVVVVFTCNSCPVAVAYEDRLIALAKKYAGPEGKVAVVAINVNKIDADRLPKMQERAKEKGFNFSYLYDDSQKIARAYGARFTPEFFVLDRERKVAYMGALDDKSDAKATKVNYVEAALDALLRGERPALAETRARGCAVRYARERD